MANINSDGSLDSKKMIDKLLSDNAKDIDDDEDVVGASYGDSDDNGLGDGNDNDGVSVGGGTGYGDGGDSDSNGDGDKIGDGDIDDVEVVFDDVDESATGVEVEVEEDNENYNDNDNDEDYCTEDLNGDQSKEFDADELADGSDDDKSFGEISYRPGVIVLYSPPVQRQRWGDKQVLPRVNWGDLFFDLFYVAATYNVSYIIVKSPDRFGFLYSTGTYWPLMGMVFHRAYYDARFVVEKDDLYHRLKFIFHLVVLSVAVLSIRPVYSMSHPSKYISMFLYSLSLAVERVLNASRYIEVYTAGIGQDGLKKVAAREIFFGSASLPFYAIASIISGLDYFNKVHQESSVGYGNYNSSSTKNDLRFLAESTTASEIGDAVVDINHAPIYLCLFGYISSQIFYSVYILCCLPGGGRHKAMYVRGHLEQ
jgi:hypothetical protein